MAKCSLVFFDKKLLNVIVFASAVAATNSTICYFKFTFSVIVLPTSISWKMKIAEYICLFVTYKCDLMHILMHHRNWKSQKQSRFIHYVPSRPGIVFWTNIPSKTRIQAKSSTKINLNSSLDSSIILLCVCVGKLNCLVAIRSGHRNLIMWKKCVQSQCILETKNAITSTF